MQLVMAVENGVNGFEFDGAYYNFFDYSQTLDNRTILNGAI